MFVNDENYSCSMRKDSAGKSCCVRLKKDSRQTIQEAELLTVADTTWMKLGKVEPGPRRPHISAQRTASSELCGLCVRRDVRVCEL